MGNIGMFGVRYKIEKKTYMDGRVEYCAFVDYSELSGKARVGAIFGTEKEARNWISEINEVPIRKRSGGCYYRRLWRKENSKAGIQL